MFYAPSLNRCNEVSEEDLHNPLTKPCVVVIVAESNREDYYELSVTEDFCLVRKRRVVCLETVFITIFRRHLTNSVATFTVAFLPLDSVGIFFEGQWSVDIMQNGDDFWLIDMAQADLSAYYKDAVPEELCKRNKENWLPEDVQKVLLE